MMPKNRPKTASDEKAPIPVLHVAHSPHLCQTARTTQRMMIDVVIAVTPLLVVSFFVFRWYAVKQIAVCLASCLAAEVIFTKMRRRSLSLSDWSATVTGIILALSLPGPAPWYVGVIASFVSIGIGKIIFGGIGMNIFNPAMVGRAFVMIAFAGNLAASGYVDPMSPIDAMTQATPMDAFKQTGATATLSALFWGLTNGSLGETSAVACIIGGFYLCLRRTASWEIPVGVILSAGVMAGIANLADLQSHWTVLHHLLGGSLLFGAFFIATDPVSSPLAPKGKFIFGVGVGFFIMLLRFYSGYPEGVMFAVLLMNALTPLINHWTIPRTFGEK